MAPIWVFARAPPTGTGMVGEAVMIPPSMPAGVSSTPKAVIGPQTAAPPVATTAAVTVPQTPQHTVVVGVSSTAARTSPAQTALPTSSFRAITTPSPVLSTPSTPVPVPAPTSAASSSSSSSALASAPSSPNPASASSKSASDPGTDPTVTVAIVLMVLGLLCILAASIVTFYWRRRKGRQTIPAAFVSYMRTRDSGISATSSWDGAGGWDEGAPRGLWAVERDKWQYGDEWSQQYSQSSSQPHTPTHAPFIASYPSPFPSSTLWRPAGFANQTLPDYIPYTGPIEPPIAHARERESWRNRPLPPLPPEAAYDVQPPSGNDSGNSGNGDVRDANYTNTIHMNVLGLQLWDERLSVGPPSAVPSVPSSVWVPSVYEADGFPTPAETHTSFSPAVSSSRFSFNPSPQRPQRHMNPLSMDSSEIEAHELRAARTLSHFSNPPSLPPIHTTAPSLTNFSFASYLSRISMLSGVARDSHISSASRNSASSATLQTGFAFNGHRSTATMYPADAVPDHQRACSAMPGLARNVSYRVLVQRSQSGRRVKVNGSGGGSGNAAEAGGNGDEDGDAGVSLHGTHGHGNMDDNHDLRHNLGNTAMTISGRPIMARHASTPAVLRRVSTTKSLKSSKSVRFAAAAEEPYPFVGFGSGPPEAGPLKRSKSQPVDR